MSPNSPDHAETPASGRRRHAPAEERRQQILEAAFTCFAEKGYHAATMDDLVRESGLSKGSLYWHFPNKEGVFVALFDDLVGAMYGEWDAAAESGAPALEVLRRNCEITIEFLSRDHRALLAWAEFINHPAGRKRMGAMYAVARSKLAATVERGRADGSLRVGPAADEVAAALVGTIEGLLLQWLVDPEFELRRHVEAAWRVLVEGLRA